MCVHGHIPAVTLNALSLKIISTNGYADESKPTNILTLTVLQEDAQWQYKSREANPDEETPNEKLDPATEALDRTSNTSANTRTGD